MPKQRFPLWPSLAGALGIGIFIFDSVSPLEFAIAVLYVVVVLIAATSYERRFILTTAGACVALTILSYPLAHGLKLVGTAPLSLPIADATMAVIKHKGDDSFGSAQDVAGKVVGSQAGSAQLQALEALAAELEEAGTPVANIRTYVDFGEAYADLAAGRLAAVVNSLPNQLEAARQRPDVFEVVLPTFGPKKYFSWAGRKDEESASLNIFMDEQIRRLNESGVLAELQRKWFGDVMELLSDELPEPTE